MKKQDILNCAFPSWYESFKKHTVKSIIIPLPQEVLDYLHTDGVVLPQSSTHGLYTKSSNMAMDGDEDDSDIRDDELMNLYEADWSVPSTDSPKSVPPNLQEFDDRMKEAITELGGRVFPKLNWSAPKDAAWISFDRTLMCTCSSDVYLLLKSSEFIAHDLDQPFSHCEPTHNTNDEIPQQPPVSYCLVLRKWNPPVPAAEFRCFVKDKKLIGICQRNTEKFYASILKEKDGIIDDVNKFFNKHIQEKFSNQSYVCDVVRQGEGLVRLTDFNPWGSVTDSLLFDWKDLQDDNDDDESLQEQTPAFRCVTSEEGVKSSSFSQYAVPLEIVDMPEGQNPFTLMEKMTLKAQQEDDSSSDENEEGR